jgi:phage portal protein BeeE
MVRSAPPGNTISLDDWAALLESNGLLFTQTLQGKIEQIENSFPGFISAAYKSNTAVYALEMVRFLLFSEARFQFQRLENGRPTDLFSTSELAILETPWPNGTTGDLLSRLLLYSDFAGNAYAVRRMGRMGRMGRLAKPVIKLPRPDWMWIVIGTNSSDFTPDMEAGSDPWDIDAEIIGYQYHPGGIGYGTPINLLPETVAHYAPIPDPLARYRGMSWMTPVIREIEADSSATAHKLSFFRNGATVNSVVTVNNPMIKSADDMSTWIDLFEAEHKGATNAYRTLYLANGADMKPVGSNMQQMDFSKTQGAGESRLAAAAGVPAAIVGFSEGLSGSSLNAGNYQAAKRRLADGTMRPLWRNVAGSLATIINVPGGARLWYDDRDIPFLAEDKKDRAEIFNLKATGVRTLFDAGYKVDAIILAADNDDLALLVGQHTGLFSVQTQAPGGMKMPLGEVPPETPVEGPGTKPVEIPTGDTSTKPVTGTEGGGSQPSTKPITGRPVRSESSIDEQFRCSGVLASGRRCNHLLAESSPPGLRITCRCGTLNEIERLSEARYLERAELVAPAEPAVQIIRIEPSAVPDIDIAAIVEAARSPAPDFGPLIEALRANQPDPPIVRFEEGAIHVEVHAPEPASVTIAEGAFRVEAPDRTGPEVVELDWDDDGHVIGVRTK